MRAGFGQETRKKRKSSLNESGIQTGSKKKREE
jgi:hypothetical protein